MQGTCLKKVIRYYENTLFLFRSQNIPIVLIIQPIKSKSSKISWGYIDIWKMDPTFSNGGKAQKCNIRRHVCKIFVLVRRE